MVARTSIIIIPGSQKQIQQAVYLDVVTKHIADVGGPTKVLQKGKEKRELFHHIKP